MTTLLIKKIILPLLAFVTIHQNGYAQPGILWTKKIGGDKNDGAYCLDQASDGGYIIAGHTNSHGSGNTDAWLIKTNADGDTIWTKTYGESGLDYASFVKQTSGGGYIMGGYTSLLGNIYGKVWLIKTDSTGKKKWEKTFGSDDKYFLTSIIQTSDRGYLILANFKSTENSKEIELIKTDSTGNTLWTKIFGGAEYDWGKSVIQTSDDGFIIAGLTYSYGEGYSDGWLIKTDANGDTIWTKTYGTDKYESFNNIIETSDNSYIITGKGEGSGEGFWLVKTSSTGDTIWTKYFVFGFPYVNGTEAVDQTNNGDYIILGYTFDELAGTDQYGWLMKTNSKGDSSWIKVFDFDRWISAYSMKLLANGGYIIAGSADRDALLIKLSADISNIVGPDSNIPSEYILCQNYPNPFNPYTTISYSVPSSNFVTLKIYNMLGREIQSLVSKFQEANTYSINFDARKLSSGIYYYRLQVGNDFVETKKMLLMR